jgi:uncharacterized membrane protein YhhN
MNKEQQAEWALWASLLAGLSYLIPVALQMHGPGIIVWKGLGVGLLALHAGMRAMSAMGRQIALVMALGAAGDVVLNIHFAAGAGLFALGHIVAIHLYWQNRRSNLPYSQKFLVAATLLGVPLIAWMLTMRMEVVFYTLFLATMAATAWASRFPRYKTGLGAMMFVASDLLIFGRMGPLAGMTGMGLAIWSLYYLGQVLIARGVLGSDQSTALAAR